MPKPLIRFRQSGWSAASKQFGLNIVILLALQLLGAMLVLATSLILFASQLFLLSSVNVAVGARGRGTWSWIRDKLSPTNFSKPGSTIVLATCLSIISFLCTGGVFANWQHDESKPSPGKTTTTSTGVPPSAP